MWTPVKRQSLKSWNHRYHEEFFECPVEGWVSRLPHGKSATVCSILWISIFASVNYFLHGHSGKRIKLLDKLTIFKKNIFKFLLYILYIRCEYNIFNSKDDGGSVSASADCERDRSRSRDSKMDVYEQLISQNVIDNLIWIFYLQKKTFIPRVNFIKPENLIVVLL